MSAPCLALSLKKLWRASMRGSNLTCRDLRGVDWVHVDLCESDLTGVDLRDSRVLHSNLSFCLLRDADLRGCRLHADLFASDLSGALRNPDDEALYGWRVVNGKLERIAKEGEAAE